MAGLFFDIQNYFKADFGGRYLALMLRELARKDPARFFEVVRIPHELRDSRSQLNSSAGRSQLQIEREWHYTASRFADLAVLKDGRPIIVFEIKEEDGDNPRNSGQLDDYLDFLCASGGADALIYIARYSPNDAELEKIQAVKSKGKLVRLLSYRNLLDQLLLCERRSGSVLGAAIAEYLEDIGVATYKTLDLNRSADGNALAFLLAQTLSFPHAQGLGKLQSANAIRRAPEIIGLLYGNLEALSDWLRNSNSAVFGGQPFARKFRPYPLLKRKKLRRDLARGDFDEDKYGSSLSSHVDPGAGYLCFYAQGRMGSGKARPRLPDADYLYLEFGICLCVSEKQKRREVPVSLTLYTYFFGRGWETDEHETDFLYKFPSEDEAAHHLRKCLNESICDAKKTAPENFKAVLNAFVIAPAGPTQLPKLPAPRHKPRTPA